MALHAAALHCPLRVNRNRLRIQTISGLPRGTDIIRSAGLARLVPNVDMRVLAFGRLRRTMLTPSPTFRGAPDSCLGLFEPLLHASLRRLPSTILNGVFPLRDKIKPNFSKPTSK
jgi:hypothetical protein